MKSKHLIKTEDNIAISWKILSEEAALKNLEIYDLVASYQIVMWLNGDNYYINQCTLLCKGQLFNKFLKILRFAIISQLSQIYLLLGNAALQQQFLQTL